MKVNWSLRVALCVTCGPWSGTLVTRGAVESEAFTASPLAPRSGPAGSTLFTEMPADVTGIFAPNEFSDPKMWGEHYSEFILGSIGTGVAIGDYDGDGHADVFVVSKTGRCRLFRNLGGWKFEDVTDTAFRSGDSGGAGDDPGHWKQGAVFADVDNDGRLDLYVCRFGAPNLLYMNQRDGTFREDAAARGLAVLDACGIGAFCDYDRDGWLDVFITTNLLDASKDPDGRPGYLFHNNGDGTFANVTAASGIGGVLQSHSATWWDYDCDGWPDLHVGNDFAGPDRLYHNNRDGTFREVAKDVLPAMSYSSMGADSGDVDNDGRIDLLVADMAATTHEKDQRGMAEARAAQPGDDEEGGVRQCSRNMLYLNSGAGPCREGASLAGVAATDWTWSVRFEDLDCDGRVDLFVTNGMVRELHNTDLIRRLMRADDPAERIAVMRASPRLNEANLAFRNLGNLAFEEQGAAWGLSKEGVSFGAAFGDLDGDGDLDLICSNYEGNVTVMRNDSSEGHNIVVALRGTRSNRLGVGATVRIETASGVQVRDLVTARGYLSSSEPVLHFGLGKDAVVRQLTVEWPGGASQTFADIPADRKLTITEPRESAESGKSRAPDTKPRTLFAAAKSEGASPPRDREVSVDFDGDGVADRFLGGESTTASVESDHVCRLRLSRGGRLVDMTAQFAPALLDIGRVTDSCVVDVDRDGWPDLVLTVDRGEVRYLHNDAGHGLEDRTGVAGFSSGGPGRWLSVATADFNGDGKPDFAAGNRGMNTRAHASVQAPLLCFTGDFGGGGSGEIDGYYENGTLYSWLSRNEMAAMIPDVRRRFPRNDAYARASLAEIVGEERLAKVRRLAVTELRSGVFLSQSDGTYRFEALPRIAQIAPVTRIATGDFDGDGAIDLVAGQNLSDGQGCDDFRGGGLGQLLRGDGHGGFEPVSPAESGLIVPGAVVAVAVEDLEHDGWPDIVFECAEDQAIRFHNNGVPGRTPPGLAVAEGSLR